jgi:hypothetical protein
MKWTGRIDWTYWRLWLAHHRGHGPSTREALKYANARMRRWS